MLTVVSVLVSNIEHVWQLFWRLGFYRGGPVFMSALSGIDIALWDLKGTLLGTSHPASLRSFSTRRNIQRNERRGSGHAT